MIRSSLQVVLLTAGAFAATTAVGVAGARAWEAGSRDGTVYYAAAPGEANHLVVSEGDTGLTLHDPGGIAQDPQPWSGSPCARVDPHTITCPFGAIVGDLGDGNDEASFELRAGGHYSHGSHVVGGFRGGSGDDVLRGSPFGDGLSGGTGDDTVLGGAGRDELEVGAGRDDARGGPGADILVTSGFEPVGDSYEPVPDPPTHADRFSGGDGYDMLWYEGRTQRLRLTADGVPDDGAPGEGDEIDPDVEHLRAGSNDDYIRVSDRRGGSAEGEGGNDTIFAGAIPWGGDGLQGGAGDDRLIGAAGRDSLGGGEGDDTIYGGPRVDYIDAGDGADVIDARDGSTPYVQISPHDDVVDCGRGVDVLHADWGEAAFMFRWDGNGCDHVDAPPEPMFQIRRRSAVEVRDRRARMTVECPSKADGPCVGSVGILVPDAQGSTKPRYGTLFVEGQLVVRPGRRKRVDMRLQPEGAKYLEHHGRPDYGALSMRGLREWRSRKGRVPLHYRTG